MKNRSKYLILILTALIVVVIDQVTKSLAQSLLADGRQLQVVEGLISLRLVRNSGAAFSIFSGYTWMLTAIGLIVVVLLPLLIIRLGRRRIMFALSVLWGGAIGNLIDRFVQPPAYGNGHVVDFIDYGGFFVGNVADIAIVVAAIVTALLAGMDSRDGIARGRDAQEQQHANTDTDITIAPQSSPVVHPDKDGEQNRGSLA